MPFYNNVYYSFPSEPQGAHSSAGIPSLLSSPQSQLSSGSQSRPTGSAMSGALTSTVHAPFKFRPRHESVDWRRINAVDVDSVACDMDFHTLQEHITTVTFCNVEGERCIRCQNQVDPALLKLFRLAQLTVEYLLHSQDCLTLSLQVAEERLQVEVQEKEQLKAQLQKDVQDARSLKEELKQKKKIIASQEAMISAAMANYHKCQHCEKVFMNACYLQRHMQRRHPVECDIHLTTDNQKKVQNQNLQQEINRLQEQLTLARTQMETLQKENIAKQEKDLIKKQEEFMKWLELWKEDEHARLNIKIDEVKQSCQIEMDSLHQRNQDLEKEVLKLQKSCKVQESAQTSLLQDSEDKNLQITHLQQKIHKQEMKWAAKLQKEQEEHESEKIQLQTELSHLCSSVSEIKEARRQVEKLELRLKEQQQIITSQSKQIKQISSSPPAVAENQEVVVPAPEPKPRLMVNEQSNLVHKLDSIVELSEEDKDSSGVSEGANDIGSWQQRAEELLKKPGLKRNTRLAMQESLQVKLRDLGIQNRVSGLSQATYEKVMARVVSKRQKRQRQDPGFRTVQNKINLKVEQRVKEIDAETPSEAKQTTQAMTESRHRPQSRSLPVTVTRVISGPSPRQQQTHEPGQRNKTNTLPHISTPRPHQTRTPPISSDEDCSEEEESKVEPRQAQKSSHLKAQANPTTVKALQCSAPHTTRSRQSLALRPAAHQSSVQDTQAHQASVVSVCRTKVTAVESESESDWTEGSEMEEITQNHLQKHTDQNGNVQKSSHSNINALTKNLEQQLREQGQRKPARDINTLPEKLTGCKSTSNVVQELKYTDTCGDEYKDWVLSSVDTSTSVWGTFTGKGHTPGLNDAGTGSTLKSSVVTVSDWDDSDDI